MTSRNYCFTIFIEKEPEWVPWEKLPEKTKYMVYQLEHTKEMKRHIQGYIELTTPLRINAVKEILESGTAHLEARRGSRNQARDYCMKPESRVPNTLPIELGTWESGGQGKRNDLRELTEMIKKGTNLKDITENFPVGMLKYHRGIEKMINIFHKPIHEERQVMVFWGQPMTGKSEKAWTLCPNAYSKPEGDWWDGYCGQTEVIIDDFVPGAIKIGTLLKILDKYDMQVPIKGGFTPWRATTIILTSNFHPNDWFPDAPDVTKTALYRRLEIIQEFKPIVMTQSHEVGGNTEPPQNLLNISDTESLSEENIDTMNSYTDGVLSHLIAGSPAGRGGPDPARAGDKI